MRVPTGLRQCGSGGGNRIRWDVMAIVAVGIELDLRGCVLAVVPACAVLALVVLVHVVTKVGNRRFLVRAIRPCDRPGKLERQHREEKNKEVAFHQVV